MNYTQQEAITQNLKVLAGLKDLFQLLTEHGAVIGRNSARIVVDLSKAPTIMQDEIGEIFRTSQLVAPNGTMGIFGDFQTDDETGILLLNIGRAFTDGDAVFAKFPAYNEVKALLESIPPLSPEQSEAIEALHEQLGVVSEFGKYRTLSLWHCRLARKRSFARSRREKAGRASAGLACPILENHSRIEPPRPPSFENGQHCASSGNRRPRSRAVAESSIP